MRVLLCSRNPNKLRELAAVLPWELEPLDADDYPPEGETSYYENARGKALHGVQVGPPGVWFLGEDSGIEVDALGGGPGIRSARYGKDEGLRAIERLLRDLGDEQDRQARYVCELVLVGPDGQELRGVGTLTGRITTEARGTEGFGYDPVFAPDGEEQTVAEIGNDWKSRNSHRARAARALLAAGS